MMQCNVNNCEETHLSGGILSPFVFPLIAIARQLQCVTSRMLGMG